MTPDAPDWQPAEADEMRDVERGVVWVPLIGVAVDYPGRTGDPWPELDDA